MLYHLNKNKLAFSFCFLLALLFFPKSTILADIENGDNPYIKAYVSHKIIYTSENQEHEALVDPKVEDQIIKEGLEAYYKDDAKVGDFLAEYLSNPSLKALTLSLVKEDRIYVMHLIQDILINVHDKTQQELLLDYLKRYVVGTGDTQTKIFLNNWEDIEPGLKVAEEVSLLATSYDANGAGEWAYQNYNKYRQDFPRFTGKFGTDCTNFVSQAMHIGGHKPKSGKWAIARKNSKYWIINSASQLNYSWKLTDPSPWISVREFNSYWRSKSKVHAMDTENYRRDHKTVYNGTIHKGHVVVLHKGIASFITLPTHIMIISAYDSKNYDFKLAGHSNERQAYPLLSAIQNYVYMEIFEIP